MDLLFQTSDTGAIRPHHDKQVLGVETTLREVIDNLHMRQPLSVG